MVFVRGSGFVDDARLACAVGDTLVPATWLAPGALECVAPAHAPGAALLRVTLNGEQLSDNSLAVAFVPSAQLAGLSPTRGPARPRVGSRSR